MPGLPRSALGTDEHLRGRAPNSHEAHAIFMVWFTSVIHYGMWIDNKSVVRRSFLRIRQLVRSDTRVFEPSGVTLAPRHVGNDVQLFSTFEVCMWRPACRLTTRVPSADSTASFNRRVLSSPGFVTLRSRCLSLHRYGVGTPLKHPDSQKGAVQHNKTIQDRFRDKLADVKDNIYTVPNVLCVARLVMFMVWNTVLGPDAQLMLPLFNMLNVHVSRIALTPVIGYAVVQECHAVAGALFLLASFTDLLDGQIARRFPGQRSLLGTMLDPVADKLLISTLFVTLAYVHLIPGEFLGLLNLLPLWFSLADRAGVRARLPATGRRVPAPLPDAGAAADPGPLLRPFRVLHRDTAHAHQQVQHRAAGGHGGRQPLRAALRPGVPSRTDHAMVGNLEPTSLLRLSTGVTTVVSGLQYIGDGAIKHVKKVKVKV